jgi:hypothetical protein
MGSEKATPYQRHPAIVSPPSYGDDQDDRQLELDAATLPDHLAYLEVRKTGLARIIAALEKDPPDILTPAALAYARAELASVREELARRSGQQAAPAHEEQELPLAS